MTIHDMIAETAGALPKAPALRAVDRPPLSYAALMRQIDYTVAALNGLGIGRGDRVAMVLPNGPEMAAAFVSVAAAATTAPLNPAYKRDEFDFYLSDLNAAALLVLDGMASPALDVARDRGVRILTLHRDEAKAAGLFTLTGEARSSAPQAGLAGADDVALVLHTSGTTSRPKVVPLSHGNLTTSAANIHRSLQLSADDRCLNVMPLFHIHGLAATVLATLSAGGSVFCTPGFDAMRFFRWFDEAQPTWYSAVPTMHQAIVARSGRNPAALAGSGLRFVRSSSAALPPRLMDELERVFGCPAIEAYGMTEAAHQMASNPLPPARRKHGSVGIAAGPEIAVMNEQGVLLSEGESGEVVIRGANVMTGYAGNAEANATAFTDGWFRTGDQGRIDANGYLFLTGRLKEMINRGGEKISPREIDEVLLEHPAVDQALAFALPHPRLGEDVGAVIVLRDGDTASEQDLRHHVASHLADFKVPRRIVFVAEIPKGPTGKLQRIGLAEKLGLS
jgi:acyl-CoA synthetase (AMP-forming)/AMP-acid ligase II